jgi:hypothetical protein
MRSRTVVQFSADVLAQGRPLRAELVRQWIKGRFGAIFHSRKVRPAGLFVFVPFITAVR